MIQDFQQTTMAYCVMQVAALSRTSALARVSYRGHVSAEEASTGAGTGYDPSHTLNINALMGLTKRND